MANPEVSNFGSVAEAFLRSPDMLDPATVETFAKAVVGLVDAITADPRRLADYTLTDAEFADLKALAVKLGDAAANHALVSDVAKVVNAPAPDSVKGLPKFAPK